MTIYYIAMFVFYDTKEHIEVEMEHTIIYKSMTKYYDRSAPADMRLLWTVDI